jgi:penicillin-binding protein 1A
LWDVEGVSDPFLAPLRDWWRSQPPRTRIAAAAAAALLLGLTFVPGLLWLRCGGSGCPNVHRLTAYQPGGAPQLLDRSGAVYATLAPVEGQVVRLASVPKAVRQAFLAVEDQRFYTHRGIDWPRVWGALWANVRSQGYEQGFSTITMQLARNVFAERIPARERTLSRKLLEVRVALAIEDEFAKDQILELYLNHVYFGNGARGIEAAARHYFGSTTAKLTAAQGALLAALLKGPAVYDPRRHPERARARRDLVLGLMEEQGRMTAGEAGAARSAPLGVVARSRAGRSDDGPAPHYVEQVRRELEERFGEELYDVPLRIRTTLDLGAQKAAEEELEKQLRTVEGGAAGRLRAPKYSEHPRDDASYAYIQGAVVALDAGTGDVLAWVGGRDFLHSRFDRVVGGRRQTGSAFKPFVYAAALGAGRMLSEHVADHPIQVHLDRRRVWEPKNFGDEYDGEVTIRDALVRSKNVPTVEIANDVGMQKVADFARRAGIESPMDVSPSLALGTVAVSPLELATAYTAFASLGNAVKPRLVLKVEEPDGTLLYQAPPVERRRVIEPAVAFLVTDVLRDAVARGTGTAARQALPPKVPVAGKTGTTNDATDAWFVGYTPEVVAAVWVGFDQPRAIASAATGGRVAAPVWGRMMARLYEGRPPPRPWAAPPGVVRATVDSETGLVVTEGCESSYAYNELFLRGHVPAETCPGSWWGGGDDGWEDEERERRRARDEMLDALREEIERRLRERRRWIEEEEERREEAEKEARRERRRRLKEEEERREEEEKRRRQEERRRRRAEER